MSELPGVLSVAVNNEAGIFALSAETQSLLFYALDLASNYRNWLHDRLDEVTDADKAQIDDLIEVATYEVMNALYIPYNDIFEVSMLLLGLVTGSALTRTIASGQLNNGGYEVTPSAINNSMQVPVFARKGYYNVYVNGVENTNYGIVTAGIVGGTGSQTKDWYAAAPTSNIVQAYNIPLPDDGMNLLRFSVLSKRAASTGYRFIFSEIWMERTGDL